MQSEAQNPGNPHLSKSGADSTQSQSAPRLGLYGGTFDPVHNGHLILARDAVESLNLDRILFLPAAISPHKLGKAPVSSEVRSAMVAAAIADEPRFVLDECELRRKRPSFAIDTVEEIRLRFPEAQLYYLIGADNLRELHTWRRIEDLYKLVQFVVLGRNAGRPLGENAFPTLERRIDISSTEVRQRVASGASIRYLVPEAVKSLITSHHLYQEPPHQS